MKKWLKAFATALPLTLALSMTAMAGQWKQDDIGWWYQKDDGSWYANCWQWIDGNGDGISECYYFTPEGYLVVDGVADGYTVNADGAWTENGVVQRKAEIDPSNSAEAVAIYQAVQAKHAALDYIDADTSYMVDMEMRGISIGVGMNMNVKMTGMRSGNLQYLLAGTMDMFGAEFPVTIFYKDGWYYADMMNMKMKQPMDFSEAIENLSENTGTSEVDLAMVRDLTASSDGENTVLTYNVAQDVLNDYMQAAMAQTGDSNSTLSGYKINSAGGTMVIDKNGYYVQNKTVMDMEMSMLDQDTGEVSSVKYVMNVASNYKNPGQAFTLTFPSTEGYTDITAE